MTNDELLFRVGDCVSRAADLARDGWNKQNLTPEEATALVEALRDASAAAQELERRAKGVPPPKEG